MPEEEPKAAEKPPLEWQVEVKNSSHGLASVYSNHFDALWTPHDIKLKFSELIKISEATKDSPKINVYEERAHIVLSWIQAKSLALALTDLITRYETLN